jgi:hypothetical protein
MMVTVIVMVSLIVMMSARGERQKKAGHPLKRDAFAREKLKDGGIFRHAHRAVEHLHAKVKIAEAPGHARGLLEGHDGNLEDFLRHLLQEVGRVVFMEEIVAMIHRSIEIEAEFPSVLGDASPAAFRERGPIHQEGNLGEAIAALVLARENLYQG